MVDEHICNVFSMSKKIQGSKSSGLEVWKGSCADPKAYVRKTKNCFLVVIQSLRTPKCSKSISGQIVRDRNMAAE